MSRCAIDDEFIFQQDDARRTEQSWLRQGLLVIRQLQPERSRLPWMGAMLMMSDKFNKLNQRPLKVGVVFRVFVCSVWFGYQYQCKWMADGKTRLQGGLCRPNLLMGTLNHTHSLSYLQISIKFVMQTNSIRLKLSMHFTWRVYVQNLADIYVKFLSIAILQGSVEIREQLLKYSKKTNGLLFVSSLVQPV